NSEDRTSRYQGGDMGWVTRPEAESRWGTEIASMLFGLKGAGELSGVITGPDAVYIFKVMEKQAARTKPLAEVKELVAYRVTKQKEAAEQKALEEKIRSGLKIE